MVFVHIPINRCAGDANIPNEVIPRSCSTFVRISLISYHYHTIILMWVKWSIFWNCLRNCRWILYQINRTSNFPLNFQISANFEKIDYYSYSCTVEISRSNFLLWRTCQLVTAKLFPLLWPLEIFVLQGALTCLWTRYAGFLLFVFRWNRFPEMRIWSIRTLPSVIPIKI